MDAQPDIDPLLRIFVEISAKISAQSDGRDETGITLSVGGFLVSGYITTGRQFMLSHDLSDAVLEAAEKVGVISNDTFDHIHMRGAKFFLPGHPPIPVNKDGVFWRGRMSDINGFSFGVLSTDPAPEESDENI